MADLNLERKYINKISSQLPLFEKKRNDLWNSRCVLCGDSKKNPFKKRFFIYLHEGAYWVKCHNCSIAYPFKVFLKSFDNALYKEYILEELGNSGKPVKERFSANYIKESIKKKVKLRGFSYDYLLKFEDLNPEHPARVYVENRKIPLDRVLFCDDFYRFINTLHVDHYKISYRNSHEPRLIIPFYRKDGLSTVFQARAFSKKETLRYITIKEHEQEIKLFGLDRIDETKPVYVLEGPIDSMMIENAISMSGISIKIPKYIKDTIYVYDNQPRNYDVIKNMKKRLLAGDKVVIFPERIVYKDLNDMIVKGNMSSEKILDIINDNVYIGNSGILRLNKWMRC
jgi:hypothetical protein